MGTAVLGAEGGFLVGGPPGAVVGALLGLGVMAAVGIYAMSHADNEAEKLSAKPADEACASCGSSSGGDPEEEEKNAEKKLQDKARPGRATKGPTKQFETEGGEKQLGKDFDSMGPRDVKDVEIGGKPGRVGKLPSGRTIIERRYSSDGRPTLEIRQPNGRGQEYRYNP